MHSEMECKDRMCDDELKEGEITEQHPVCIPKESHDGYLQQTCNL